MKATVVFCRIIPVLALPAFLQAQQPINTVSVVNSVSVPGAALSRTIQSHPGSVNNVQVSTNYTVSYNNGGNINISDFSMGGKSYVRFGSFDTVIIRRVANAYVPTNGNKQHIYAQGPGTVDNVTYNIPLPVAFPQVTNYNYMERVIKEGFINRGSDNIFNNDGTSDLTFNNIERIDIVFKIGFATTHLSSAGFVIAERGGNDAFKIAAITGIDVNGNPTSFGPVLQANTSAYGNAVAPGMFTFVMRRDVTDTELRPFSHVPSQTVKATFISLSDLGVAASQRVYGYAIMAPDVTATTSAQLLNYTNPTYFPTNTTNAVGGMDMASAPGIFHTDMVLSSRSISLSVQNQAGQRMLHFTDEGFANVSNYEVERAADGRNFETIGVVMTGNEASYVYKEQQPRTQAWYRIKAIQPNGNIYYSSVIFVTEKTATATANLQLYPNPASDKLVIQPGDMAANAVLEIFSADGRLIKKEIRQQAATAFSTDISQLKPGLYHIKLYNNPQQVQKASFVVSR